MHLSLAEKSPRADARSRFERFIAAELEANPDVGTDSLAETFMKLEWELLRKIAYSQMQHILVKWADDILGQSIGRQAALNGRPQLTLPMSLRGMELPGAFSFVNGANKTRFVANYKAQLFHLESHALLMRKHEAEVHDSRMEHEMLLRRVKPVMVEDPAMTLPEALKRLADAEAGAE
jgi:hypothetical protein